MQTMRIGMKVRAGPDEVFAPDAFDSQIGKTVPVRLPGLSRRGRVVGAQVSPDGRSCTLTVEVPDIRPFADLAW